MTERFRRLRRLAFALAPEIHPDRFAAAGLPQDFPARLAVSPRAAASLSLDLSWTRRDVPPVGALWEGVDAEGLETFLAGGGAGLRRAGLRLGAGHARKILTRFVVRADVACLKAAIGDDAYFFAVRQAPLFWRKRELPGDAIIAAENAEEAAARARAAAGWGLGCFLADLPAATAARVRLTLPPEMDADMDLSAGWPEARRGAWRAMLLEIASAMPAAI